VSHGTCSPLRVVTHSTISLWPRKKYVFIYDRDGVELHCLKSHMEPTRLEFLPYHWLLASVVRLPSFPSFPLIHILSQGQCRLSKIPRYISWSTSHRTPHKITVMHYHVPKRSQCRHPSRPSGTKTAVSLYGRRPTSRT
jgi:hypothetical protein